MLRMCLLVLPTCVLTSGSAASRPWHSIQTCWLLSPCMSTSVEVVLKYLMSALCAAAMALFFSTATSSACCRHKQQVNTTDMVVRAAFLMLVAQYGATQQQWLSCKQAAQKPANMLISGSGSYYHGVAICIARGVQLQRSGWAQHLHQVCYLCFHVIQLICKGVVPVRDPPLVHGLVILPIPASIFLVSA